MFDNDIPAQTLFFSVSGSTYRRQINSSSYVYSNRFRVCLTVPLLEYLHEVRFSEFSGFISDKIFEILDFENN